MVRIIAEDDVAGLLAAEIAADAGASPRRHSGRRPRCACSAMPLPGEMALEPEIRHDGGDDAAAARAVPLALPVARDQRHQLIAVEQRGRARRR